MRLKSSAGIAGVVSIVIAAVWLVSFLITVGYSTVFYIFLVFAVLFAVVGLICLVPAVIYALKLKQLKRDGFRYPARVIQSTRVTRYNPTILRIGGSADTTFVCAYTDDRGKSREVFSRRLFSGADAEESLGMKAVVYVDRDNPERYAVEVFDKESNNSFAGRGE